MCQRGFFRNLVFFRLVWYPSHMTLGFLFGLLVRTLSVSRDRHRSRQRQVILMFLVGESEVRLTRFRHLHEVVCLCSVPCHILLASYFCCNIDCYSHCSPASQYRSLRISVKSWKDLLIARTSVLVSKSRNAGIET